MRRDSEADRGLDANLDSALTPLATQIATLVSELAELVAHRTVEIQRAWDGSSSAATAASPWLSAAGAAEYLDWPKGRLYKLSARGEVPHYKHDGRLLFRRDELDAWLSRFAHGDRG